MYVEVLTWIFDWHDILKKKHIEVLGVGQAISKFVLIMIDFEMLIFKYLDELLLVVNVRCIRIL